MVRFSSPAKQAAAVIKALQGGVLKSVSTASNYEKSLTQVAKYIQENKLGSLRQMTPETAKTYLEYRGQAVGQKTLDMERQALQCMMRHVTRQLNEDHKLPVIKSELEEALSSRAYPVHQVEIILKAQQPHNALATEISFAAGLRAHELFTLRPAKEQPADPRPKLTTKWQGIIGDRFTVTGKGGLTREVVLPWHLTERLEALKLDHPSQKIDRGIYYTQYYAIGGGKNWSSSFSEASKRHLGWSSGAHGLRHSYAQSRMEKLQSLGLSRALALETVSQEMGHFRPDITEVYLR
ncbi:site-specific integrase [Shewanella fidelis]|uniref:Site-specific integrase n=1 Tax=Shewanella fidelis TaxID=173509 RepID=A0AAW8NSR9_9GAMM|nr:site-specific integrase [Shewanella fidelis]MDW4814160.1 site-specific integrase [Shewanella fidelis]MDW4818304.1 site-specific integrase [Shewanella fidelis]MDW4822421.1 site-specific integrase [Shewanella fidelis]MDW4826591.1 site-specific integrase [Shewanella fidelis]